MKVKCREGTNSKQFVAQASRLHLGPACNQRLRSHTCAGATSRAPSPPMERDGVRGHPGSWERENLQRSDANRDREPERRHAAGLCATAVPQDWISTGVVSFACIGLSRLQAGAPSSDSWKGIEDKGKHQSANHPRPHSSFLTPHFSRFLTTDSAHSANAAAPPPPPPAWKLCWRSPPRAVRDTACAGDAPTP